MGVIYTANRLYRGPDRVDVTAEGGDALGSLFAPSWALREAALEWKLERGDQAAGWRDFVARYAMELEQAKLTHRDAWTALLARDTTTLVCACAGPGRCHRSLLAAALGRAGALHMGERPQPYQLASLPPPPPLDEREEVAPESSPFEQAMAWCTERRVAVHYEGEPTRELTLSLQGVSVTGVVGGTDASSWQRAFVELSAELRERLIGERSGTRIRDNLPASQKGPDRGGTKGSKP